jgi:tRNA G18 (ribose-2'-O)-methylase SpoU
VSLPAVRERRVGAAAVARSLRAGEALQLVLHRGEDLSGEARRVLEACRAAGVSLRAAGTEEMTRLSGSRTDVDLLGLVGRPATESLAEVLAAPGVLWLLVGTAYPGNAGFVIRTAEVSGADGVIIDADFDHAKRRETRRASMRADRFFPVFFERAETVFARPELASRSIFAVENRGERAPWDADLRGPSLCVVGGERTGIPEWIVERADAVLRLPMLGFVATYNLHAAMAAVASERLRQLSLPAR